MEVWKDIPGYEGIYQASTLGRIRSKPGKTTHSNIHGLRRWKTRILKEKCKKTREMRVTLWKDKKPKDHLVHRLIAATFIPKLNGKDCVNHKDGNPRNNNITNLEWCDHKENNNHAFDTRLIKTAIPTQIYIANEVKRFRSMSKASEYLGLSPGAISNAHTRGENKVAGVRFTIHEE